MEAERIRTEWKVKALVVALVADLREAIERLQPQSVHVLTDEHVRDKVLGRFPGLMPTGASSLTVIPAGDCHKDLDSLQRVWSDLSASGATRRSLLVNIGGGMVTDLGGFAAATFKRGIRFINVSTTLLGAVDASIGGKTGINFQGLKNEIGAFAEPEITLIATETFATLPAYDLLSGFGEVLKTGLLDSPEMAAKAFREFQTMVYSGKVSDIIVGDCLRYKSRIVAEDPFEKGIRKCLNLGHTAGHALESFMMRQGNGIPHGVAVAHGLLVDLILSNMLLGMDGALVETYAREVIRRGYGSLPIGCNDYEALIELMRHDKKNASAGEINFTLLHSPGDPQTDVCVDPETVESALDIYRDLTQ